MSQTPSAPETASADSLRARQDTRDVQRVLDGDTDAFEGIVRRWQGPLVNLAYRFSRDRSVAEELAQEAFVKIFRNLGRWRASALFSTWLFAVALNVYRSWARKKRPLFDSLDEPEMLGKRDQILGLDPSRGESRSDEPAIHRMVQREEEELVRRAVLALPEKFRDALVLFYFQEEDLPTTARVLGRPEGTVKAHLHRGRKLLAKRLGGRLERLETRDQESGRASRAEGTALGRSRIQKADGRRSP